MPTKLDRVQRRSQIENVSCTIRLMPEKLEELIEGITAKEVALMMERCYRRGYTQGAWAAMEAAKADHEAEEIRQWFVKLLRWRGRNHKGEQEIAPQIEKREAAPSEADFRQAPITMRPLVLGTRFSNRGRRNDRELDRHARKIGR